MIQKLEPMFPELAKRIDELRKKTWKEAADMGKIDFVVCGFCSLFEDDVIGKCSKCNEEVSVRGWLKKEMEKYSVPIICLKCAMGLGPEATIL